MIQEHYRRVVEQVQTRLGKQEQNIVMVQYEDDFSVQSLKTMPCFTREDSHIWITWYEFPYHELSGGYEPFLDIICGAFRRFGDGNFSRFLSECGVYVPHREVLESYYRDGFCLRREMVLMDEVRYEQERMTKAIGQMLRGTARYCPMLIVLNRFQLASKSTLELVGELLRCPCADLGIVLGVNEKPGQDDSVLKCWEEITEALADSGHSYHIGSSDQERKNTGDAAPEDQDFESLYRKINNTAQLLDYDQAFGLCQNVVHRERFEGEAIPDGQKLRLYPLYARVSILRGDFATALEVLHALRNLKIPGQEPWITFASEYYLAMCRMYQGKLGKSYRHAQRAEAAAEKAGSQKMKLEAQLLEVQAQMSGWYNLFFCLHDIEIPRALLSQLQEQGYDNFLAHIYVYAFDNDPERVAKSCRREAKLNDFNQGIALAQKIGNAHLLYNAQQKNIMISDTYGNYPAAVFYLLRAYQLVKDKHSLECGRIYSALGYNFSALGKHRIAEGCYHQAIRLFLEKRLPEDIAEVYYNMSLGSIMQKHYPEAERRLLLCVRTVDKLRLNSLRVCNLAKLYGLLALDSILQQDCFGCRRYLDDCAQLLNNTRDESMKIEINHDYAKLDDERFLYWFSNSLLSWEDGDLQQAYRCFQTAESFLEKAKSNQFYAYRIFYEKRMELAQALGCTEQYEQDRQTLEQYEQGKEEIRGGILRQVREQMQLWETEDAAADEAQIEALLKQEAMARELRSSRRRMEFVYAWQKLMDGNDGSIETMVSNAMYMFLNEFGNDCALYVRYCEDGPSVLYNDTGVAITPELLACVEQAMKEYSTGFAVSKISGNFLRHRDVISCFGADRVCSFAAVPFFKSGRLESVLLTYVLMKENWHASMESYRINKGDLAVYRLLFRELGDAVNRLEAYEKIYEMNQKLSRAASTDMLTGLYNRTGLYNALEGLMGSMLRQRNNRAIGLMFIDLDNFKYYNDTFGHNVGDVILISMARVFREIIGARGIVSRFGGDEFLIVLEEGRKEEMEQIARAIYQRLETEQGFDAEISRVLGHPVEIDGAHRISYSIGIAMNSCVREEKDIHDLIKRADDILYSVKKKKKGTYAFLS